jgi:molybdopterin-containing oxidoreductase family iron-sulfur binding subunit
VKEEEKGNEGGSKQAESSRRELISDAGKPGASALIGAAPLMARPKEAGATQNVTWDEWFQTNYRIMTDEQKAESIARLEKRDSEEFAKKTTVADTEPMKDVLFGYALNIQKCTGCRRCVKACVKENNQSRHDPQIEWIRVVRMAKQGGFSVSDMDKGYPADKDASHGIQVGGNAYKPVGVAIEHGQHYYQPEKVPEPDYFYFPVQCQNCEKPACVKVCPIRTTYRDADGIVVIDYNWCFGCRMCMDACPYWARRFNTAEPKLPVDEMNPKTHYLGNRPRMRGVVEKCTFCIQRSREGRYPACVEACPAGARKFGNLLDPDSEVRRVIHRKRVFRLKIEFNTFPKFFYYMD